MKKQLISAVTLIYFSLFMNSGMSAMNSGMSAMKGYTNSSGKKYPGYTAINDSKSEINILKAAKSILCNERPVLKPESKLNVRSCYLAKKSRPRWFKKYGEYKHVSNYSDVLKKLKSWFILEYNDVIEKEKFEDCVEKFLKLSVNDKISIVLEIVKGRKNYSNQVLRMQRFFRDHDEYKDGYPMENEHWNVSSSSEIVSWDSHIKFSPMVIVYPTFGTISLSGVKKANINELLLKFKRLGTEENEKCILTFIIKVRYK